MDVLQRFLKRIHLINSMDLILREAKYHRDNNDAEQLPEIQVWRKGEEVGEAKVLDEDS